VMRRLSCRGLLQPAAAFLPDLPDVLHRRRARRSVLPAAASHSIRLVKRGERRVRHPGEFPAEVLQLRPIQRIGGVHDGHLWKSYHALLLFACCDTLLHMALFVCGVTFRHVRDIDHSVAVHAETTMDAAALGLKPIREQKFVMEDLTDPVTVELVTSTQHKVSLKKVMEWMAHAVGTSPKEIAMEARVGEW